MNYLDIFIILVLCLSGISGYKKGFIHQLASLTALILGIYVAVKFSGVAAPWLKRNWSMGDNASHILAFLVVFFIVLVGVHMAGRIIEKVLEDINIGVLNKLSGSVFAIAKTVLILSVVCIILSFSHAGWPSTADKDRSLFYKPIESIVPGVFPLLVPQEKKNRENNVQVET